MIPINTPLIDSLSLKIPFLLCEVLDLRLTSETCVYYESLQLMDAELHPPKPIIETQNGITLRFSLCEIPIYNKETDSRNLTKFIVLTLSAKLLKERYFEGINKKNIELLYNEFMSFKIFNCSFDTFLDSMSSDTDICINRYVNSPVTFETILKEIVIQCGTKQKFAHLISQENNLGLSLNKRAFAKPSIPFIKFYFKNWELLSKSYEFYSTYLTQYENEIINLTRVEATIKNYAHKDRLQKFGILPNFKTLRELLEIETKDLYKFVVFSLNSYIEQKQRVKIADLSPTDYLIFELIQNCVIMGFGYKSILSIADNYYTDGSKSNEVARSRMRKKITDMYDLLIHKSTKIKTKAELNNNVSEYINFVTGLTEKADL
jgi:hypothetical protein